MSGKRDEKIRRKAEARAKHRSDRTPYLNVSSESALRAHDKITSIFLSGLTEKQCGVVPREEIVARMSYLRGLSASIDILKEEMKKDEQANGAASLPDDATRIQSIRP